MYRFLICGAVLASLVTATLPAPGARTTETCGSESPGADYKEMTREVTLPWRRSEGFPVIVRSHQWDEVRRVVDDAASTAPRRLISLAGHRLANGLNAPMLI